MGFDPEVLDERALVEIQPLPLRVCTGCDAPHERNAGECLHCDRRVDYLEVRSEDDRKTAIAAIVLD